MAAAGRPADRVTMSWLLGADASFAAVAPRGGLAPFTATAFALERIRPRHGGVSWQGVLAAAALGANVCALAYLARRMYSAWMENEGGEDDKEKEKQQQQQQAEEDQSEVTRAALAYLQRLWDIAMQVRAPLGRLAGAGTHASTRGLSACCMHSHMGSLVLHASIPVLMHATLSSITHAPPPPPKQQTGPTGAPADLGLPDADGIYTYEGLEGARLYFRLAPRTRSDGKVEPPQWQWSTSKRLWLPTSAVGFGCDAGCCAPWRVDLRCRCAACTTNRIIPPPAPHPGTPPQPTSQHQADSIWMDSGDSGKNPGLGGRLLIRRLELESQLVCGARCRVACAATEPLRALPPLELPILCAPRLVSAQQMHGGGAAAAKQAVMASSGGQSHGLGVEVPDSFLCPLSQRVMTDPVVTPGGFCGGGPGVLPVASAAVPVQQRTHTVTSRGGRAPAN